VKAGELQTGLTRAHKQLHITAAQDADWTRMTQQVTTAAQPFAPECDRDADTPPSYHEEATLLRSVADMGQALTTMYGKLDAAQKDVVQKAVAQAQAILPALVHHD
jgi:hypothetical protein